MADACPYCGRHDFSSDGYLKQHIKQKHPDAEEPETVSPTEVDGKAWSTDDQPQPKKRGRPAGSGGAKRAAPAKGIPLAVQLELPYRLLSNVAQSRLPATAKVLDMQAKPCAQAWDQLLLRYPALREKIEQGMIAGDVVGLIMAHLPIIQVVREEIAFQQAQAMQYADATAPA